MHTRTKRTRWVPVALSMVLLILLSACGAKQSPSAAPSAPASGSQTAANSGGPVPGGTLIVAIGSDPSTLNPALTTAVETLAVGCKMFNGLVYLDRNWAPQPELATAWDISPDGKKVSFTIRGDVLWHDGQKLTSEDVKFTFEKVLAKLHPRTNAAFKNVSSVEAPNPTSVVVNFNQPYAPFMHQMTCQEAPILPKHIYDTADIPKNPRNVENPVGSGPFKFDNWVRGDHIKLVKFDKYFKKGQPYLDAVVIKVIADSASRVLALQSGDVDYIQSFFLPKNEMDRLKADPKIQIGLHTDLPGNYIMFFNTSKAPLDRAEVRQALATGLNREQIVKQAFFGMGEPGKAAIHRRLEWASSPNVDYSKLYTFDTAKANELLDKAGLPRGANGTRFRIRLVFNVTQAGFDSLAQIVRDNWKALGVDVVLEPQEAQLNNTTIFTKRDFDVTMFGYTTAGDPAIGITRQYVTAPPGLAFTNPTGYSNTAVDELATKAAVTPSREERAKFYFQMQEIIAKDLPTLNLVDRIEADAASAGLKGLFQSAEPYDLWDRVWWEKGKK